MNRTPATRLYVTSFTGNRFFNILKRFRKYLVSRGKKMPMHKNNTYIRFSLFPVKGPERFVKFTSFDATQLLFLSHNTGVSLCNGGRGSDFFFHSLSTLRYDNT